MVLHLGFFTLALYNAEDKADALVHFRRDHAFGGDLVVVGLGEAVGLFGHLVQDGTDQGRDCTDCEHDPPHEVVGGIGLVHIHLGHSTNRLIEGCASDESQRVGTLPGLVWVCRLKDLSEDNDHDRGQDLPHPLHGEHSADQSTPVPLVGTLGHDRRTEGLAAPDADAEQTPEATEGPNDSLCGCAETHG